MWAEMVSTRLKKIQSVLLLLIEMKVFIAGLLLPKYRIKHWMDNNYSACYCYTELFCL